MDNHSCVILCRQAVTTCSDAMVAYEIALSTHRLVSKYGTELQPVTWDALLQLLAALLRYVNVNVRACVRVRLCGKVRACVRLCGA